MLCILLLLGVYGYVASESIVFMLDIRNLMMSDETSFQLSGCVNIFGTEFQSIIICTNNLLISQYTLNYAAWLHSEGHTGGTRAITYHGTYSKIYFFHLLNYND